jgi:hypothetical protein
MTKTKRSIVSKGTLAMVAVLGASCHGGGGGGGAN